MSKLNLNSKQEIIGSAKTAFSINFPFYVFALGILLAFSAFQCQEGCEEGYGDPLYCGVGECETINVAEITVEEVICGVGVWDNFWFNDGSNVYLQPYSLDEYVKADIENMEIKDNMRLKVSFQYTQEDNRYDGIAVCEAYVGEKNPIKIMAIEVVNN
ncbi:hypothetical protein ACE193_03015 [Bernardetia sp. OM2101]|uniref:hypothetical protein n=1 Tax=Bernardetia sp. OM2101 TaxID=3344876 RepID=UPI0035CFB63C